MVYIGPKKGGINGGPVFIREWSYLGEHYCRCAITVLNSNQRTPKKKHS